MTVDIQFHLFVPIAAKCLASGTDDDLVPIVEAYN